VYHTVLVRTGHLTYHHTYSDVPRARVYMAFTFVRSPLAAPLFMVISHARLAGIDIPYCLGPHGLIGLLSCIHEDFRYLIVEWPNYEIFYKFENR